MTVMKILMTSRKQRKADSSVESYVAESIDQYTTGSRITTEIPPLFDGSTSWFKYDELVDDWLDLTVTEAEKDVQHAKKKTTCRRRTHA